MQIITCFLFLRSFDIVTFFLTCLLAFNKKKLWKSLVYCNSVSKPLEIMASERNFCVLRYASLGEIKQNKLSWGSAMNNTFFCFISFWILIYRKWSIHTAACHVTGNTFLCSLDFNVKMALKLDVSTRAVMGLVIGEKKFFSGSRGK